MGKTNREQGRIVLVICCGRNAKYLERNGERSAYREETALSRGPTRSEVSVVRTEKLLRRYRDDYRADLILHVRTRLALTRRNGGRKNKDTHRGRITSYRIGYGQVHVLFCLLFLCPFSSLLFTAPFDCRVLHD